MRQRPPFPPAGDADPGDDPRAPAVAGPAHEDTDGEALDTAWRIHAALADVTGKVDAKASFCVAVESAVLFTVVNLTAEGRLFHDLDTATERWTFYLGLALVAAGLLSAADVVIPRLRRQKQHSGESRRNFIYFGQLRHWDPEELEAHLKGAPVLPVLSAQLVNMSRIAWRKHVMVQASLLLALLGASLLGWCALLVS